MSKEIVAAVPDAQLQLSPLPSDRLVYSNYYIPVQLMLDKETPALPFYQKQRILEAVQGGVISHGQLREVLADLGYDTLWDANEMELAWQRLQESQPAIEEPVHPNLAGIVKRATVLGPQDATFVAGFLRHDIGVVFLDRTRITPVGLVLGEHVYALGLAPDEEAILEQKTFTKRQMTLEEQTDQERQFDLELASTYSTELQEGLERQRSLSDNWGLNLSHTGQYNSPANLPWGQITASHTVGTTRNVTDASQQTARESVKNNQTASAKVAARYRTQHKTTFRVVTEEGFEVTSKRTIRNPNRTTPVTLHYFKVMQKLQLKQERYGARLCWAPNVKDPAASFFGKIAAARKALIDSALQKLPPKPVEPAAPPVEEVKATTRRETRTVSSPIVDADKWGFTGDQRAEYDVDIPMPQGFAWDGNVGNVTISLESMRPHHTISRWIVGVPYMVEGGALKVWVHIGAPSWLGGPRVKFQVHVVAFQDVTITEKAGQDAKYFDDLAVYRTALKQWQDQHDAALKSAQHAGEVKEAELLRDLSPVNEMIAQIIEQYFPPALRDEMWEIDQWQSMFDWERATFVAYPSWWSGGTVRDPLLDPADFINASWAKLYLPVRLNMELPALRWIFGKAVDKPLDAQLERSFEVMIRDLESYRHEHFGAAGELEELTTACQPVADLHECIASWDELIPTDGTHVEVIQGATTAADDITAKEISDAEALRAVLLANEKRAVKLQDKAETLMKGNADVQVTIAAGGPSQG